MKKILSIAFAASMISGVAFADNYETVHAMAGVFDTTTGTLVGIAPQGQNTVTFLPSAKTNGAVNFGLSTTNTAPNATFDQYGRLLSAMTDSVPTIATNACGTTTQGTVAVGGTSQDFVLTVGTTGVTSCAVTFANAWVSAPHECNFAPANATAAAQSTTGAYTSAPTTTGWTLSGTALAGASYVVHCQ